MRTENIRSYAIGRVYKEGELLAVSDGEYWRIQDEDGSLADRNMEPYDYKENDFDNLPEAIEAGKAYLKANGGEVYPDDDDKRIEELESQLADAMSALSEEQPTIEGIPVGATRGVLVRMQKRIEELEAVVKRALNDMDKNKFATMRACLEKALEVKQ